MIATYSLRRTLVLLIAATSLVALATTNRSLAGSLPTSDQMVITDLGVPIFNQLIPEPPTATTPETSLTWFPGTAPPLPPVNAAAVPGASIVLLTEPTNEVPDPGEIPITISDPRGTFVVSDIVISTVGNQVQAPFQVSLVSDGDPDLATIVNFLQSGGAPWTPLPETGLLQNLTPFLIPAAFPWTVGVLSDVNVPEPSTLALATISFVGLAAWGWRRRRSA